ncbi:LPS export ABC transporter periplasmic protein LptC [Martelella mediterranea]|uniref:LPS export ABC transporter periplasmic protein LptC n=1 Tax=Martelella mediterranea TaxID=293089 RepID=UPI001E3141DE|nr:LPS export ABC transporter periplasmic protein LptC [Martelella mediterranea]MCD1634599.1 LPS export ABC transporter periplasmic protein LptC [Martelella mediterranea]
MTVSEATDRASIDQAFRRAAKHTRTVRRLKILLPIAAFAIAIALIAMAFVQSLVPDNLSLGSATIEDGMIVMTNPGITGRNRDGIPYSLKADRALLPAANPDDSTVLLENVTAQVPVEDSVTAVVDAARTLYDRATEYLNIDEPFTIKLSNGMHAEFNSAAIDIQGGTLKSDDPVTVTAPQASVVARNVNITDNGQKIRFGGGVHVTLSPSALGQGNQ